MKLNLFKSALVTAAAYLAVASSGHGSTVSAHTGDLLLSFYDTDSTNQGYSFNLEVDLGSINNFLPYGAYQGGATFNLTNLAVNDISTEYGSDWNTSLTSLEWAVVGTNNTITNAYPDLSPKTAYSLFGSEADPSSPYYTESGGSQQGPANSINGVVLGLNGVTASSGTASADVSTGGAEAFSNIGQPTSGAAFGFDQWGSNLSNGTVGTSTSDLYEIGVNANNINATDLGTFTLSSSGLTFTGSAVPEPSTWAAVVLGAGSLFVFRRRRLLRA